MIRKTREKIIMAGADEFAKIAYEYFTYDSPYEVAAFSVEKEFMKKKELFGLPIIPFEEIEIKYNSIEFKLFVAISFTQLNTVRTSLYNNDKEKGYSFVSYISSKAFVWRNVEVGENCFIFENSVIQYCVIRQNKLLADMATQMKRNCLHGEYYEQNR